MEFQYDVMIQKIIGYFPAAIFLDSPENLNVLVYIVTKLLVRLQHKAYHVKEQVRGNIAKVMDC